MNTLFILNDGPYGTERSYNGLRLARSLLDKGVGQVRVFLMGDAAACAQELFAVLRELDATGVKLIWVETPPEGADWDGVRDRLQRAAA